MSTKKPLDLGSEIRVSPSFWPDCEPRIQPGNLSIFAPKGNGFYGYQDCKKGNPFTNAPPQEACGGVIYFGNDIKKEDLEALMRIMDVKSPKNDFAVFTAESEKPDKDGFLAQARVVSKFGLRYMFGVLNDADYEKFPPQEKSMLDVSWSFIEYEKKRWGTSFLEDHEKGLQGLFGGDGNYAREELSFGFMMENNYHNVCRIWSRAWLVTK